MSTNWEPDYSLVIPDIEEELSEYIIEGMSEEELSRRESIQSVAYGDTYASWSDGIELTEQDFIRAAKKLWAEGRIEATQDGWIITEE